VTGDGGRGGDKKRFQDDAYMILYNGGSGRARESE